MAANNYLYGMQVIIDANAMVGRWVFPKDPFIEYEAKDEKTCRYFGIGHEVFEPGCYQIGLDKLIIHPEIWAKIEESCQLHTERYDYQLMRDMETEIRKRRENIIKKQYELPEYGPKKDYLYGTIPGGITQTSLMASLKEFSKLCEDYIKREKALRPIRSFELSSVYDIEPVWPDISNPGTPTYEKMDFKYKWRMDMNMKYNPSLLMSTYA